ncbi:MAG TPA: hypothetical protein VKW08_05965 [Xanthobacteraceae bacterium]|nr:hypothetical protein [Xanthobacteraceae bacterium]
MIDRRHAIRLACMAVCAAALPLSARAQQGGYQRFVPYLVELPGWKGAKAEGMGMEMAGSSMLTATRNYERGGAHVNVSVLTGLAAQGALAATNAGIKLETPDVHITNETIDGMQVSKTYTVSNKSGAIVVTLGPAAVLTVAYTGIPEEEAMGLARRFDWKAIQGQVK